MFQVMSKFMTASMQPKDLDKEKKRLDVQVCELEGDLRKNFKENRSLSICLRSCRRRQRSWKKELVEELKIDIIKKETCLDHLQRTNDELSKTKEEIIAEFKASNTFSKITDEHYAAGFKDFC